MSEHELIRAIRALAASAPPQAPPAVEQKLLAAFRQRQHSRIRVRWVAAAVAAAALAAALAFVFRLPPPPRPEARVIVPPPPALVASAPGPVPAAKRAPRRRSALPQRPLSESSAVPEVATKFYELPDADIFAPVEDATVVRVQLPRSFMRVVGLPVNEDRAAERIRADVVLGQDGIARAVRFVQ